MKRLLGMLFDGIHKRGPRSLTFGVHLLARHAGECGPITRSHARTPMGRLSDAITNGLFWCKFETRYLVCPLGHDPSWWFDSDRNSSSLVFEHGYGNSVAIQLSLTHSSPSEFLTAPIAFLYSSLSHRSLQPEVRRKRGSCLARSLWVFPVQHLPKQHVHPCR